jgi:mRNA interferase YafO
VSGIVRIFKSRIIRQQFSDEELSGLADDFKHYKSGHGIPDRFGRDELYDHSHTLPIVKAEEVRHIHLADAETVWSPRKIQYNKTSDSHLVYCQGALDHDCYLLMVFLAPEAHRKARDNNWMFKLGAMAEQFRKSY